MRDVCLRWLGLFKRSVMLSCTTGGEIRMKGMETCSRWVSRQLIGVQAGARAVYISAAQNADGQVELEAGKIVSAHIPGVFL